MLLHKSPEKSGEECQIQIFNNLLDAASRAKPRAECIIFRCHFRASARYYATTNPPNKPSKCTQTRCMCTATIFFGSGCVCVRAGGWVIVFYSSLARKTRSGGKEKRSIRDKRTYYVHYTPEKGSLLLSGFSRHHHRRRRRRVVVVDIRVEGEDEGEGIVENRIWLGRMITSADLRQSTNCFLLMSESRYTLHRRGKRLPRNFSQRRTRCHLST